MQNGLALCLRRSEDFAGVMLSRQEMILDGAILEFSFRAVEKALVAPLGISAAEAGIGCIR